jgi:hypothetical protein
MGFLYNLTANLSFKYSLSTFESKTPDFSCFLLDLNDFCIFNPQKSLKFLKLSWFLVTLSHYQLITMQILFPLENVLSLLTGCVSLARRDKKIYEYFIVTVQTFFISFSCFAYRNKDLNSSILVRTEPNRTNEGHEPNRTELMKVTNRTEPN